MADSINAPLTAQQQADEKLKRANEQKRLDDLIENARAWENHLYFRVGTYRRNPQTNISDHEASLDKLQGGLLHIDPDSAKVSIHLRYDEKKRELSIDFNPQFFWEKLSDTQIAQAMTDMITALQQEGIDTVVIDAPNISYMSAARLDMVLAIAEQKGVAVQFGPNISSWLARHGPGSEVQERYRRHEIQLGQQKLAFDELTKHSKPATWKNEQQKLADNQKLSGPTNTDAEKEAAVKKVIDANISLEEKAIDETAAKIKAIDKDISESSKRLAEIEKTIDQIVNGNAANNEKGLQAAVQGIDNYQHASIAELQATHDKVEKLLGSNVYKHEDLTLKRLEHMKAIAHNAKPEFQALLVAAEKERVDLQTRLNVYKRELGINELVLEGEKNRKDNTPERAKLLEEAYAVTQRHVAVSAPAAPGAAQTSALDKQLERVQALENKIKQVSTLHADLRNRIDDRIIETQQAILDARAGRTPGPGGPR